jgi:5-methylthioadenosine/S-adenosylhomocysteine deaminase
MSERREERTVTVIQGCELWTPGRTDTRLGVDIHIEAGRIIEIVDTGSKPIADGARLIDAKDLLAIPGLVNAHSHSPENCLRGLGEGQALEPWLLHMFGGSGLFTPEDHYICALAGAVEMLQLGITSVVDHLWMTPPNPEAIDATMRAFRDAGIRAAVAPLMDDHDYTDELAASLNFDLGLARMSEHVGMPPADELISMLSDAFDRWHGEANGRLRILAGPGGVQWASEELLTGLAETARAHGSGVHIHLLETPVQDAACRNRFGRSGVSALADLGVLGPDCSLPHSVWATPEDVELIAERGAIPVHNPAANLRLGSGRAPIPEFIAAGATVGLGADGSASSDNQNLWEGIKLASFMHNNAIEDRWLTSERTLAMATKGGAAVIGLAGELGEIKPGALADITLIDRYSDGLAGAVDVPVALAIAESGRGVRHVMVEGELVVEDGRLLTVDADAVRRELAEQSAARRAQASSPPEKTVKAIEDMKRFRKHLIQTSTTIGR